MPEMQPGRNLDYFRDYSVFAPMIASGRYALSVTLVALTVDPENNGNV